MKDHGQQARASENFAGPLDFETPRPDLPVHFLNFHKPNMTYLHKKRWLFVTLRIKTSKTRFSGYSFIAIYFM